MVNSKAWLAIPCLAVGTLVCSDLVESAPRPSDYFCYERTRDGAVVNLTDMCQKVLVQKAEASSATATSATSLNSGAINKPANQSEKSEASAERVRIQDAARRKKVEFSDYSYDGNVLLGTVKNRTGKPIGGVAVVFQVEVREGEGKWRPVDSGKVQTNSSQIDKGGKTNFSTTNMVRGVRPGDRVTITDVELR